MTVQTKPTGAVKPLFGLPPLLAALLILVASLAIHLAVPVRILAKGWIQFVVAAPIIGLGVAISVRSLEEFESAGTDEPYAEPTTVIVEDGPYSRTRNPMFLGAALVYLGVGVAANAAWVVAGLFVWILYLHIGVIRREERYLEDRFGDEYTTYLKTVPRWIPRITSSE